MQKGDVSRGAFLVCVPAILQCCLSAIGCAPAPSKPPNILLITLDTTRADHIGAYGDARAQTPRLDRLAANGVLVGDHGESLGEHDEATHAIFVYQAAVRVPMIVAWPGHLPAGRRVRGFTRAIDLAPTLLDLAGQPSLAGAQGQSVRSRFAGGDRGSEAAYSETYFPFFYMNWAPLRSLQDGRWKYIDAPIQELYDLENDPREQTNLASREPGRVAAFAGALKRLTGGAAGAMSERKSDPATVEKLAALGYIGATSEASGAGLTPEASPARNRPDPKTMIGVFNQIRAANASAQEGRPAESERLARRALDADPNNAFAIMVLAQSESDQGKYRDAVAAYRRYARLVPGSADAHHRIAICLSRSGDAAAAEYRRLLSGSHTPPAVREAARRRLR